MLLTGWLRKLGVSAWSRLRLRRDDGVGISPVLDPAGVTVKAFSQAMPDPVRWSQGAFVARLEPVRVFLFDRQPLGSASAGSSSPDDLLPQTPADPCGKAWTPGSGVSWPCPGRPCCRGPAQRSSGRGS